MIREKSDPVSGGLTQKETLVPTIFHGFNWGRRQTQTGKALMRCLQVIDHEIERSIARFSFRLGNENQVRTTPQFQHRNGGFLHEWAHANRAHEAFRFFQPICLQDNMPYP
jgi:hypothetical protein